jgi:hypothetical protein
MIDVLHELNRLDAEGRLQQWVASGIISPVLVQHREIYLKYDAYITTGVSKASARTWTADLFQCSEVTVLRAVARFCPNKHGYGRRTRYVVITDVITTSDESARVSCA